VHLNGHWPNVAFIKASGRLIESEPDVGDTLRAVSYTRTYAEWPKENGSDFTLPRLTGAIQPGEIVQVLGGKSFSEGFRWIAFKRLRPDAQQQHAP
jgi:hypothetical protein